ncbi:1-acyl-sn-glycerol-3-phosphate acyltransferase 3 [Hondaea fermentalgiana]|uniref:1-acyl-sn-glycerol-3-phosphate acyltransferase 3 n=1 Tax=Hondaea fermentalgiana TaxID=2315210 RepID=A0A2R5GSQ5_9STRA|nr:1-acyl-sn-glycerol-3-phosphate acyltransferase 3 [Hondaea fermentalgiana]|eukprot:GBG31411.1 1-acyl-sn-glycerol-3-phosphate acyltransferase 3 [Hondaea fermentalgiana]
MPPAREDTRLDAGLAVPFNAHNVAPGATAAAAGPRMISHKRRMLAKGFPQQTSSSTASHGFGLPTTPTGASAKLGKAAAQEVSSGKSDLQATSRLEFLAFYARIAGLLLISIMIILVGLSAWPMIAPFHRGKWRTFIDQLECLWVNALLWLLPATTLEMHGDFPTASSTPKLLICNHATDVDWIYQLMPMTVVNFGTTDLSGSVKIFLKQEVKNIPIVGWGCALFEFVFLKRDWAVDRLRIENSLTRFCKDGGPITVILYPEGSTVNTRTLDKCRTFARVQGRPEFDLTLLPRVRGFAHICETLAKHSPTGDVDVFDQTMAFDTYSGEVPDWEMGFKRNVDTGVPNFQTMFLGRASRRCHIDSRRFSYRQLKQEYQDSLENWLDERWARKESLLREFIEHQQFDSLGAEPRLSVPVNGSIRRSLMAVTFYIAMWVGMAFTYSRYSADFSAFNL